MLIALHKIMSNGEHRRILVNHELINYMEDKSEGYGSIVYAFMGSIRVVETTKQIEELVSSKTQSRGEIAE